MLDIKRDGSGISKRRTRMRLRHVTIEDRTCIIPQWSHAPMVHKCEILLLIKHSNMMSSTLPNGIHSLAVKSTNISTAVSSIVLNLIAKVLSRWEWSNSNRCTTFEGLYSTRGYPSLVRSTSGPTLFAASTCGRLGQVGSGRDSRHDLLQSRHANGPRVSR